MACPIARIVASVALLILLADRASALDYSEADPIPPGATGEVLAVSGIVLELKAVVLPLVGVVTPLGGKVDPLQAALKDLGAQVQAKEIKIALSADVLFDFDKAELRQAAEPELEKVAIILKSYAKAAATIEGHTDAKGSDQYNQRLSERRAESVRRWLAGHGVGTKMAARGLGETRPVAPNAKPNGDDDPEGRQKNRRVEITVRTQ